MRNAIANLYALLNVSGSDRLTQYTSPIGIDANINCFCLFVVTQLSRFARLSARSLNTIIRLERSPAQFPIPNSQFPMPNALGIRNKLSQGSLD
ncbi:MAG: hypothetical protein F6J93_22600 [Oscillatoria sp. SIO1A7]|nr:hypothetical protein [Oscillatoria sp. SIO1A7]